MNALKEHKPLFKKGANEIIFRELKQNANRVVAELEPNRRKGIIFKAILFPALYFVCWIAAIFNSENTFTFYFAYFSMGILLVLNYLNIIHDAVHNTIFKNRRINEAYVYLFDLMGANSYIWKIRHIRFHHNYPNVNGWDTDIDQSKIVRVVPQSPVSRFHKYQHIYLPFVYPVFLFNWLLIRDFKDFLSNKRTVKKLANIPVVEYIKLFFFKTLFFFYMLVIPVMMGISFIMVLLAFIIMLFTASVFALIVLLPPHANVGSDFPAADENGRLPHDWFMHMLKTTNDVDGTNWFTRFVMGNYNFHIVHHLFPNVHHSYYPEITQELKILSHKYNLPYRSYSLTGALKNHYLLLKQNSADFNIWEEDM